DAGDDEPASPSAEAGEGEERLLPDGELPSSFAGGRPPYQQHQRTRDDPHRSAAIGSAEASRATLIAGPSRIAGRGGVRGGGGGPVPARPAIAPAAAPGCRRRSARSRRFPGG